MTRECINIARLNDCFLSFTGFANGAWLAEHSLYYAHQEPFKHRKSKAVLFDSPGMVKTEEELEDTGITSKERKFSIEDMNVVNYLTAPCFANSCNRHVGIVYRLFVDEEKFILDLEEHLNKCPLNKRLGEFIGKISKNLKNYKFFLIGLASMFNHSKIDLIVNEFLSGSNGRPKYCERVKKWPVVKLKLNGSSGKTISNNIKIWTSKKVKSLCENVPGAQFAAYVVGKVSGWAIDKAASKLLPGDYMLFNILIELSKGKIQMDHFQNPNFYKKIGESVKSLDDENVTEIPNESSFSLFFVKHYVIHPTNYKQKELNSNQNLENNDYCLECLHELKGKHIKYNLKSVNIKIKVVLPNFKPDPYRTLAFFVYRLTNRTVPYSFGHFR